MYMACGSSGTAYGQILAAPIDGLTCAKCKGDADKAHGCAGWVWTPTNNTAGTCTLYAKYFARGSDPSSSCRTAKVSSTPVTNDRKWDPAYFYSGGRYNLYDKSEIGKNTTDGIPAADLPLSGADPSCGDKDATAWGKGECSLVTNKYGMSYTEPMKYLLNEYPDRACNNCNTSTSTGTDCNGTVQLTNKKGGESGEGQGRVAAAARAAPSRAW